MQHRRRCQSLSPDVCGGHADVRLMHHGTLRRSSERLLRLPLLLLVGVLLPAPARRVIRPPLPLMHSGMRHHLHAGMGVGSCTKTRGYSSPPGTPAQHSGRSFRQRRGRLPQPGSLAARAPLVAGRPCRLKHRGAHSASRQPWVAAAPRSLAHRGPPVAGGPLARHAPACVRHKQKVASVQACDL